MWQQYCHSLSLFRPAPGNRYRQSAAAENVPRAEDGRARIRIERCGATPDRICGYIVWMKETADAKGQPFRDRLNPDASKRGRLLLGHQMLLGLKLNTDGRHAGEVYNAEDGKTYRVSIWREGPGMLAVKGCLMGLFCATQGWVQVTDLLPGQLVGAPARRAGRCRVPNGQRPSRRPGPRRRRRESRRRQNEQRRAPPRRLEAAMDRERNLTVDGAG
ncbi:DUF2147 domain-containing protein [Bradyrhizobium aeschynomenes]|uniref:DUF2147 domain-containing protein n=1 Tax=Bradyrhizobium aeschynomenes TaxID=2734909 RepID=UPI003221443F